MGNHHSIHKADRHSHLQGELTKETVAGKHNMDKHDGEAAATENVPEIGSLQHTAEAMGGRHQKTTRHSKKSKKIGRSATLDTPPKRHSKRKSEEKTKLGRSVTDSAIEHKWHDHKKKSHTPLVTKDLRAEMDPNKLIALWEHYSEIDPKLAHDFIKAIQQTPPKRRSHAHHSGGVPKAA